MIRTYAPQPTHTGFVIVIIGFYHTRTHRRETAPWRTSPIDVGFLCHHLLFLPSNHR